MIFFSKMRLTSLMTFFAISSVFFSVMMSGIIIISIISGLLRTTIIEKNNILADAVAYEANDLIVTYENALSLFALPENRTQRSINHLRTSFAFFETIHILDNSGKVILSSGASSSAGYDMSKRDFFMIPHASGKNFISTSFISKETYNPTVSISVPCGGGVITGFLNLKNLTSHIDGLSHNTKGKIAVTDDAGYYIAHTEIDRVNRRESAAVYPFFHDLKKSLKKSFIVDDFEGSQSLLSCSVTDNGGWTVLVAQDTSDIFKSVQLARLTMLILMVVCSAIALITMFPFLRVLKKNIADLAEGTNRIAEGDYSSPLKYTGFSDFRFLIENFSKMAEALQSRETTLRNNEKNMHRLINRTPIAMLVIDKSEKVIMMNDTFTDLFGYTIADIPDSAHWWTAAYPDKTYREQVKTNWYRMTEFSRSNGSDIAPFEAEFTCASGGKKYAEGRMSVIGDRNIIIFSDLTDRRATEHKIAMSEKKYHSVFETAGDAMFIFDKESGAILESNTQAEYLYQYTKDELKKMNAADLSAKQEKTEFTVHNEQLFAPTRYHRKKNGSVFPVDITVNYTELDGKSVIISNIRDITEKQKADNNIIEALTEKNLLLKEIHHRVKNNLKIIISLLSLQMNMLKDHYTINAFTDSMNRIRVMAAIHERLYRSEKFAYIEFSEYVTGIAQQLITTHTALIKKPRLEIDIEPIQLDLDKAVPCGLIINEIITNSLKYAYRGDESEYPVITISMHQLENIIELIIGDNGIGIPETLDIEKAETLGLRLITALIHQLRGKYSLVKQQGTTWTIHFSIAENKTDSAEMPPEQQ